MVLCSLREKRQKAHETLEWMRHTHTLLHTISYYYARACLEDVTSNRTDHRLLYSPVRSTLCRPSHIGEEQRADEVVAFEYGTTPRRWTIGTQVRAGEVVGFEDSMSGARKEDPRHSQKNQVSSIGRLRCCVVAQPKTKAI